MLTTAPNPAPDPVQGCLFCGQSDDGHIQHLRWVKASDAPRPTIRCVTPPPPADTGRNGDGRVTTRM